MTIRQLSAHEAALFRTIRLEALRAHPESFGASYEQEAAHPLTVFAQMLIDSVIFGGFSGEALLGIVGFRTLSGPKMAHKGVLWGMYVRPEARGTGLARRLVEALLGYARGRVELVQLTVVAENEIARRLYVALGFTVYGVEPHALKIDGRYLDDVLMAKMLS